MTEVSSLFHSERIFMLFAFKMMVDILLNHLGCDIAYGNCEITSGPKMLSLILFAKFGKFHLQSSGGLALEIFD